MNYQKLSTYSCPFRYLKDSTAADDLSISRHGALNESNGFLGQQLRICWESRTDIIILLILHNESEAMLDVYQYHRVPAELTDSSQDCSCIVSSDYPTVCAPADELNTLIDMKSRKSILKPQHHHCLHRMSCNNRLETPSFPNVQFVQTWQVEQS